MRKFFVYILILTAVTGFFGFVEKASAESPKDKVKCGPVMLRAECATYKQPVTELIDPWGTCSMKDGTATRTFPAYKSECSGSGFTFSLNQTTEERYTPASTPQAGTTPQTPAQNTTYKLLSPLPCPPESTDCTVGPGGEKLLENYTIADANPLSKYINIMLKIFIGICAILAMIMITLGGLEYMTSELPGNKESGKNKITQAVLGLLLALGAWLILWTINPDLLVADLASLTDVVVEVDLESDVPQTPVNGKYVNGTSVGVNWETTSSMAPTTLPSWLKRNNGECQTVGQKGCTSTRGLLGTHINAIHTGCPTCQLVLTGGTEFWEHGGRSGNTTHKPGSATVDLRRNPQLDAYLSGGKPLVKWQRYPEKGGLYLFEGNHWHIGR